MSLFSEPINKFYDRPQAGVVLSKLLKNYNFNNQALILALPRGGVPVAYEIAKYLHLPLDVLLVRKLGVPTFAELAMGAIASGGVVIFNEAILKQIPLDQTEIDLCIQREKTEIVRREQLYRSNKPPLVIENKIIILVDDGIATGATMKVAIAALRVLKPLKIIVAVPVAPKQVCDELKVLVDELVCPLQPVHFNSVSLWYDEFTQTSDEEVITLLQTV